MMQFSEVIRVLDGVLCHTEEHYARMYRTMMHFFGSADGLRDFPSVVPEMASVGTYKCRIVYDSVIREVSFQPYFIRPRHNVLVTHCELFDYSFKYLDRSIFDDLMRRRDCDDVVIVCDGNITDSCYANLVFASEEGLFTPITPLLKGTCRERLIREGVVSEREIRVEDLNNFDTVYFINAMMPLYSCGCKTTSLFVG